jgi:hypothetical protein
MYCLRCNKSQADRFYLQETLKYQPESVVKQISIKKRKHSSQVQKDIYKEQRIYVQTFSDKLKKKSSMKQPINQNIIKYEW